MPRAASKKGARGNAKKLVVTEIAGDVEQQGFFPFVARSYPHSVPGMQGYKEEKDQLLIGFRFGQTMVPPYLKEAGVKAVDEITPYDFLTNPKTGLRQGQTTKPNSMMARDLSNGVTSYTSLPPLWIWNQGEWLWNILWEKDFKFEDFPEYRVKEWTRLMEKNSGSASPEEIFNIWVVSGEGTPGNNLYVMYELPMEIAKSPKPKHPAMWPEEYRKAPTYTYGVGTSLTSPGKGSGSGISTSPPKSQEVTIPAGVRYRCPGCGHWYNQGDLPGHAKVCGKGDDADWAMMCDPACGCKTLDEAAKPKPGFPRVKPEATAEPKEEGKTTKEKSTAK